LQDRGVLLVENLFNSEEIKYHYSQLDTTNSKGLKPLQHNGKLDSMKDQEFIFGLVLIIANKMDTLLDRELKEYAVTAKQCS